MDMEESEADRERDENTKKYASTVGVAGLNNEVDADRRANPVMGKFARAAAESAAVDRRYATARSSRYHGTTTKSKSKSKSKGGAASRSTRKERERAKRQERERQEGLQA